MAWSYWEHGGVEAWATHYPLAKGNRQSPVDIDDWIKDSGLSAQSIKFDYKSGYLKTIRNNGHSWQIDVPSDSQCEMVAKHLSPKAFHLLQVHAHWGTGVNDGSEHMVKGQRFAGEVHMVHWNSKYEDANQASAKPDGIAVVGIFLKRSEWDNPKLATLFSAMGSIRYKGQTCALHEALNPEVFLPNNRSFWTYEGSLTTPPCSECVLWTVFEEPIAVGDKQLEALRSLSSGEQGDTGAPALVNNVRPTQPLGARKVRFSAGSV
uniref:Carbonic anhydrase n=1 Tax=Trichuris muris TaxID=70415 RepID=A0A5S6QZC4_TRIMR